MSKHYIRLDINNNVVKGFSDAFEIALEADICINENGERHFELNGEINPSLVNMQNIYLYKYVDNEVVTKTNEEIQQEISNIVVPKTDVEILKEENANLSNIIDSILTDIIPSLMA